MSVSFDTKSAGVIAVAGELSFATVTAAYDNLKHFFKGSQPLTLDLAAVNRCDSAGIALLVEWQKQAKAKNLALTYTNIVPQMQNMLIVCGVDSILL